MSTPSYNDGNMSPDMMMTNEEEEVEAMSNDELVGAMLQAKNDRRRAESDVQLLANRLAHLRAEEEKARRKIAETQRRAKEVRDIKIENARIQREKMEEKRQRQEMVQREQQRVAMRRAQQRAKRKGANSKLNKMPPARRLAQGMCKSFCIACLVVRMMSIGAQHMVLFRIVKLDVFSQSGDDCCRFSLV